MQITAITQSSPGRFTVSLEDGSEIRSTLGVITDMRLFSGKEMDENALAELRRSSVRSIARDKALEYISRRRMSRKELKNKLMQKGQDEDTAEYCAQWLQDHGFLDDESYAAAVARHYAAKGYGAGRVRAELSRRGVSRELWEDAIDNMPEPDGKLQKLISARLKDPNDREQIRKLSASLYRRGYSWEEIRSALRRYSNTLEETNDLIEDF